MRVEKAVWDDVMTLLSETTADLDAAEFMARTAFDSESPGIQAAALHLLARLLHATEDRLDLVRQRHPVLSPE